MRVIFAVVSLAACVSAPAQAQRSTLDPEVRAFLDGLPKAPPIYALTPGDARLVVRKVQSVPVAKPNAIVTERVLPIGPTGQTKIRVIRPRDATRALPAVVYFHGDGWILGDLDTHDRLAHDLAAAVQAVLILVDYDRSPEKHYPVAIEQDYVVTKYVAEKPGEFGAIPGRLAVAGDSVGGNMAAVISLLAKERGRPAIAAQLLFYPVTDSGMDTASYRTIAEGPWPTKRAMAWFCDAYLADPARRGDVHVSPIRATQAQLTGPPRAMVVTAENNVLREEGEAYAAKLAAAGVPTTSVRYNGTIHDFVLLNALADTTATRSAIAQAGAFLRGALASLSYPIWKEILCQTKSST